MNRWPEILAKNWQNIAGALVDEYLDELVPPTVAYHCLTTVFPPRSFFHPSLRRVFGLCSLTSQEKGCTSCHLVFYVVDLMKSEAVVFDPNGETVRELWSLHNTFYRMESLKIAPAFNSNIGEDDRMFKELEHVWKEKIGMTEHDSLLEGYCATLSLYYMVEWVCSEAWRHKNISHFQRATRDFVFNKAEMKSDVSSMRSTYLASEYSQCTSPID